MFDIASKMVEAGPLADHAKITRHWIEVPRIGAIYRVLSADAPTKHGLNPHAVIFDELHAQPKRELWDVMTTGHGGPPSAADVGDHDRRLRPRHHLLGAVRLRPQGPRPGSSKTRRSCFRWWGADEDAEWDDPDVWQAANPNYGESVSPGFLESEARKVKHTPGPPEHVPASLPEPVDPAADTVAGSRRLGSDGGHVGRRSPVAGSDGVRWASTWRLRPTSPPSRTFFPGRTAATTPSGGSSSAAAQVEDLDRRTAGAASTWAREGWLTVNDGDVIDYQSILGTIDRDITERGLDVRRLSFDRWGSPVFVQALAEQGLAGRADGPRLRLHVAADEGARAAHPRRQVPARW